MANSTPSPADTSTNVSDRDEATSGIRAWRKWILLAVGLVFLAVILYEVVNPYRDQPYEEIPHGDHVHYVPKDRNPDIPVSQFPTSPPGPNERLTPDGQIVPQR